VNFLFYSLTKKITLGFIIIAILGSIVFLAWPGTIQRLDIISSNPNPLIRLFAPTWNSLKHIGDLPYIALYILRGSNLPLYEITLSAKDKTTLLENLPDYPRVGAMWEEYKKSVKGEFQTGDFYTDDADIRIRGVSSNHWNAVKKSWQINLPAEQPLGERTTIRLILPEDKGWVFHAMNATRARELGLISPDVTYVRLHINGTDMGIYHLVEGWEESMLEKNGRGLAPLFSNINLDIRDVDLVRPDSLHIWENRFAKKTYPEANDVLAYFVDLIANAPADIFEREFPHIVDMDMYYRWLVITALSGNFHQSNIANQNWYLNPATGKLEPILFDTALYAMEDNLPLDLNRLVNRTMQVSAFRKAFSEMLQEYLADESHKDRALAQYDELSRMIRVDILQDTKKIQTTAAVLRHIEEERVIVEKNYDTLRRMLEETGTIAFVFTNETYPVAGPFDQARYKDSFLAHQKPLTQFLREYPQFVTRDNRTLALPAGTHVFPKTVIIPEGYTVIIDPGARLAFGPDVSLFSFSTVYSNGTRQSPITMQSLDAKKPWGVFAVLNAPEASVFRYARIENGNEALFQGLYFSGSLSVRASDLEFLDGYVARSHADDGIHAYGGNIHIARTLFENTGADSVDLDFVASSSILEKNTFRKTGENGDAMDLSFSTVLVRDNIIMGCTDKGISAGEKSQITIERNIIAGCSFGIAVKDDAAVRIMDTLLLANETGLGVYRKKPHFIEGGHAFLQNTTLWNNKTAVFKDEYSTAEGVPSQETFDLETWKNKLMPEVFMYLESFLAKKNST